MGLTVQNVYGLLLRSRLLPANDAKALYERWQKEARDSAGDIERFRRWMVTHRYLTDYQAGLLCKGHAEGFFIGEYKILDKLGRGRMAGVYKAVHSTGQILALKVLPPSKAKVAYLLSRFEREAKLAIKLKHANVVRAFQMGYSNGLHWIVMEYLEGETLDDVLARRRRLPPNEAARLIWQALQGMQHIHDKSMVHRDLKPSNIMLTPGRVAGQPDTTQNSVLKILDIGLGRMFFDENVAFQEDDETDQLTGEGVLLGTPDYLAPEQARSARTVDIRADVYSIGCVLYHCISGQVPYPDTNIITQMIRHAQETPRPLREFSPDISEGLQQVINVMMAKDPGQRYPTPAHAAAALQAVLSGAPPEPVRIIEDESMSSYLLWLEGQPNGTRGQRKSSKGSKSGKNRHSKHGSNRWRRKKKKYKEPVAAGVVPPPAWAASTIDVELVAPPGATSPRRGRGRWWLLIVALVAVIAAVAGGAVLAYLNTRS